MLRLRVRQDRALTAQGEPAGQEIVPAFADPYLELVRLVREAAEIELALLVQYLYCAFSVKVDKYPLVRGTAFDSSGDLLGVAVQEMKHLQTVSQLLVALGAAPHLAPQDFPYDPGIYPFPLHLEPMSRASLAKYVYAEAPAAVMTPGHPDYDAELFTLLSAALGDLRPNHLGSLYGTIIAVASEPEAGVADLAQWVTKLELIRGQGEADHFELFKDLFLGVHEGFEGHDVWSLSPDHPDYPSLAVPVDPVAYEGDPRQIADPAVRRVAWLADLQYWAVLLLLDLGYRRPEGGRYLQLAIRHMTGPLSALGAHLPTVGAGLPFDPPGTGASPGIDPAATAAVLQHLLRESQHHTSAVHDLLPAGYPVNTDAATLAALDTGRTLT